MPVGNPSPKPNKPDSTPPKPVTKKQPPVNFDHSPERPSGIKPTPPPPGKK